MEHKAPQYHLPELRGKQRTRRVFLWFILILQEKQRISTEPSPDGRVQAIIQPVVGEGSAGLKVERRWMDEHLGRDRGQRRGLAQRRQGAKRRIVSHRAHRGHREGRDNAGVLV